MASRKKTADESQAPDVPVLKALKDMDMHARIAEMAYDVKVNGWRSHSARREQFGDAVFAAFTSIAFRDERLVVEVPQTVDGMTERGYAWGDPRYSRAELKRLPPEMQWIADLCPPPSPRYNQYKQAVFDCRWTNRVLGGMPVENSVDRRVFLRNDVTGDLIIPALNTRAMIIKALPQIDKSPTLSRYLRISKIVIPASTKTENVLLTGEGYLKVNGSGTGSHLHPVTDEGAGSRSAGKGLSNHEALPANTRFTVRMEYPSSEISLEQLTTLMQKAGEFVRLSPAKSSGFGDFEVERVNGQSTSGEDAVQGINAPEA